MEYRLHVTASLWPSGILYVISNVNIVILDLLIMTFQAATIARTMHNFVLFLDIFIRIDALQIIIFPCDERLHFYFNISEREHYAWTKPHPPPGMQWMQIQKKILIHKEIRVEPSRHTSHYIQDKNKKWAFISLLILANYPAL